MITSGFANAMARHALAQSPGSFSNWEVGLSKNAIDSLTGWSTLAAIEELQVPPNTGYSRLDISWLVTDLGGQRPYATGSYDGRWKNTGDQAWEGVTYLFVACVYASSSLLAMFEEIRGGEGQPIVLGPEELIGASGGHTFRLDSI